MGRKEQVKRSAEQKWEIPQEGLKSGFALASGLPVLRDN